MDVISRSVSGSRVERFETSIGEIGVLINGSYDSMEYLDLEVSNTDFIADPVVNGQRIRLPDIDPDPEAP